jgi:hypothetical protein
VMLMEDEGIMKNFTGDCVTRVSVQFNRLETITPTRTCK